MLIVLTRILYLIQVCIYLLQILPWFILHLPLHCWCWRKTLVVCWQRILVDTIDRLMCWLLFIPHWRWHLSMLALVHLWMKHLVTVMASGSSRISCILCIRWLEVQHRLILTWSLQINTIGWLQRHNQGSLWRRYRANQFLSDHCSLLNCISIGHVWCTIFFFRLFLHL